MSDYTKSVAGVVIRGGKVLLARHTYGRGAGKLICPGGYIEPGESPEAAVVREYREETGVEVRPKELIAVRFNNRDWYMVFRAEYVSGTPASDHNENSEVVWLETEKALEDETVPYLSKEIIRAALSGGGLSLAEYDDKERAPASLYRSFQDIR
ncbi:MAG: NUDIX hydrolase [Ruminococcus sp.]|nr:NUDIX hydrolase [Ruminococcus sp.]